MTPAHRSWIVFLDGRSKNLKRLDFGRCSRLQVWDSRTRVLQPLSHFACHCKAFAFGQQVSSLNRTDVLSIASLSMGETMKT